jgi:prolyl-tRNA synthetase
MKYSQSFIFTQRNLDSNIESISHQLCVKAGLTHQVNSGIYSLLPLGQRVINNIINLIKQELNNAGCLEVSLPIAQPIDLWKESGRWQVYGEEMIKFKSRELKEYCLGPTHEELICNLVKPQLTSYKQLPFNLYQIGKKFRDELRPQHGLIRTKEFIMKDAYSFHVDQQSLDLEYSKMKDIYLSIFSKLGLTVNCVVADSGEIGGGYSEEFITKSGIEVGHIFKLGDKYTKTLTVTYTDNLGKLGYPLMGCYGIGVSRLLAVIIEENYDDKGIKFPKSIAPFQYYIIPIGKSPKLNQVVEDFYFTNKDVSLLDDRSVSTGVKFKDADLLGIPFKVVISEKNIETGIEITAR